MERRTQSAALGVLVRDGGSSTLIGSTWPAWSESRIAAISFASLTRLPRVCSPNGSETIRCRAMAPSLEDGLGGGRRCCTDNPKGDVFLHDDHFRRRLG